MTTLITSLNIKLYEEYGQRMIEGFARLSRDVKLIVVFEGAIPAHVPRVSGPVSVVELKSEEFDRFRLFFGKLNEAHGLQLMERPQPNGELLLEPVWDYRFNLFRFAFKIFSIDIARRMMPADEMFGWLDADVACLKSFSSEDLLPFFPDQTEVMSYLGRTHFPPENPYSECGFLGFNPANGQVTNFLNRMKALYTTGEAFRFQEWHDSWLWDEVRKEFEAQGFRFKNISGAASHLEHPFINCGLGTFFDHLKGPERKQTGKSFDEDYEGREASAPELVAYGCGSPIRLPVVSALAQGCGAQLFVPEAEPVYKGGDSLVWGLIRGAPQIMQKTREAGRDFFQIDNAYFGRDRYFRVTRNGLQLTQVSEADPARYEAIFREVGYSFAPWKENRTGPIVLCPSSELLFNFYGTTVEQWLRNTAATLRRFTDRPIVLREKQLGGIEEAVGNAWCVVTHVSAAALDALRVGVPVITTADCAATPLATPIEQVATPLIGMDRAPLFATLAWGQFTPQEMQSGFAWEQLRKQA